MPRLKSYGVFISHAWDYNADYYRLEQMLENAKQFRWRNCSVPKHKSLDTTTDAQLEAALRRQIRPANAVLIISGMYVNNRKWIQKEIDIAIEMNKPIIALKPRGAQRIPQELKNLAPIVNWNAKQILNSIRYPSPAKPEKSVPVSTASPSEQDGSTTQWHKDISSSPDFSELRDWIENPSDRIRVKFDKRGKNIERRRGMHG
ncbi:hypothetical protein ES703_82683 [subsurface metagenome]